MNNLKNLIGLSVFVLMMIASCKNPKKKEDITEQKTEIYAKLETNNSCFANATWFQIDPATKKRKTPPPKEDSTSVFGNNTTVSNCNFHQWSWQKFLWLTNDISGRPLFMDKLIQVNSHTVPVPNTNNKIILSSKDNAQATGDILRTNKTFNANNTSYDVYYSIHVDSTLYNSIQKFAPMNPSKYKDETFPIGSLELKIAWVNVDAIKDTSSYFITDAVVEGKDTKIALLGMHVVGIVYNHPEFVWATFEHNDLAPYYNWEATTTTSDVPVTSKTNKLLFNSDSTATIKNLASNGTNDNPNVFAVNKYGVPRQAKNTFLNTSQDGAQSYNNIKSINTDVQSKLADIWKNYFYNGSVWIDTEGYKYPTEQAQLLVKLTQDSLGLSYAAPGRLVKGSVAAYNITMETYEQLGFQPPAAIHQQSVATMGNCFSCHSASYSSGSETSRSALNISHIFNGAVNNTKGLTTKFTKQKHLDEIKEFVKKMK